MATDETAGEFRAMTPDERELVILLLKNGSPEGEAYLPQLNGATVRSDCRCGCPSFEFNIPLEHQ